MLKKRTVKIGEYDTAAKGWTLNACKLSDPEQKTNYVEKAMGDGSWDCSTIMTDGLPRYKDRTLTVKLECSEGTRDDRTALLSEIVNKLDGFEWHIVLPDKPDYYVIGRVRVVIDYHDLAHAGVTITGTCRPWYFKESETVINLNATATEKDGVIVNGGRRAMVPTLEAVGSVLLEYGTNSINVTEGEVEWPTLLLTPGSHAVKYSGNGTLKIKYREAVLQ